MTHDAHIEALIDLTAVLARAVSESRLPVHDKVFCLVSVAKTMQAVVPQEPRRGEQ